MTTTWEMVIDAIAALDGGHPIRAKGHLRNILRGIGRRQLRWEYYIWLPSGPDRFEKTLAELGQRGWELVLQHDDKTCDSRFIFKRLIARRSEEL